ncbi:MAG: hypothetical protein C0483_14850 [Pirellula sp.]|nr:hypothetical protein [Pirellula sp.]
MKPRYAFEFCDVTSLPGGLRECLYEIMEFCNSGLRSFNGRAAEDALSAAREHGLNTIVEVGAGRAPLTTQLVRTKCIDDLRLVPCDLVPNQEVFRTLQQLHPQTVDPIFTPVDLTQPQPLLRKAVIAFVGVMHHIPFHLRVPIISALHRSGSVVIVLEPLARSWRSMFLASLSLFMGLLLPLFYLSRPGNLRRFVWCWLIPLAPWMFVWDGIVSCLRQWTAQEWRDGLRAAGVDLSTVEISSSLHSTRVCWTATDNSRDTAIVGAR